MIQAVIIDDEQKSRKLLRNLLNQYCPDVNVLAMASSAGEGLEAIEKYQPDLIFLDIVMPGKTGFNLIEEMRDRNLEVIFTTAYDEYALEAFRHSALDYLLKPINIDELKSAINKFKNKFEHSDGYSSINQKLDSFLQNSGYYPNHKKIGLPTQQGINFVEIEDIIFCKAEGNYSIIYFIKNGNKEIITRTLKEFEEMLSGYNFIRVHRSYLINLDHIREYSRTNHSDAYDGDGGCVVMSNNVRIPVSRDKRRMLLERFSRPF